MTGMASGWTPPLDSTAARQAAERRSGDARIARPNLEDHEPLSPPGHHHRPDDRRSILGRIRVGFVIGHVGPEAFLGGPIALVEDGDTIVVDLEENWIDCLQLDDSETYQQASRTLVADDDHVVVVKVVGPFAKCMDQGSFAVEDASVAREDPVRHPALDTGELQDRSAIGSEIPLKQAHTAGGLERPSHRIDHPVIGDGWGEPIDLFPKRLARARERISVEIASSQELADHCGHAARGLNVHHRVGPKGSHVDQHGQAARQLIELCLGKHLTPEVDPRRPGDLDAVEHDVDRATHGNGHGERVA